MGDLATAIRQQARRLTGADGVTFVLREGEFCHYLEEDAVEPLWKGRRFPLETCISGWCMLHKQIAVIPDIYVDSRIPFGVYRPTFVRSLVMVPVRVDDPLAAIGTYWAKQHQPDAQTVALIEALARATAGGIALVQTLEALNIAKSGAQGARGNEVGSTVMS